MSYPLRQIVGVTLLQWVEIQDYDHYDHVVYCRGEPSGFVLDYGIVQIVWTIQSMMFYMDMDKGSNDDRSPRDGHSL